MTNLLTLKKHTLFFVLLFLFASFLANAQIGIGTVTPNASSVLDVTSTTQGLLTPRMTTAQRNAIVTPADGLLVYDIDLKAFYFYSAGTSSWVALVSSGAARLNFKRIKSTDNLAVVLAAELAAGGGAKYLLNTNTLYEINGTVTFNFPIDLNNAYIQGLDPNEDVLTRPTGNLFEGATGGGIKSVTLIATMGSVFNLNANATQNLILRDSVIANSASVGTISGLGLVFLSIIQYSGNTNGITYNNITQLLLSNLGWFGNNGGTYEKLTGTFTLVEKQGGFSQVEASSAIGFDVSTAGLTITGDAVLESVVFTGANTAGYVKGYTSGTYTGYYFNNSWNVRSAGIPTESDASAVGDFAMDYTVGSGLGVSFDNNNPSNIVKVGSGTPSTTYSNLFRFTTDAANRLRYAGKKKRIFQITGSISFQVPAAGTYIIYIAKNGTVISQYKIYGRGQALNDIVVLPLNASTEMVNNDYIEVYAQRFTGLTGSGGSIVVPNMVITIK